MINGWLTLTSLKNGKIVKMFSKQGNRLFKMYHPEEEPNNETLFEKRGKEWVVSNISFWELFEMDCMVTEDYDLTFEEALKEMLDGKVVASEHMPSSVLKFDKKFMWASAYRFSEHRHWTNCATLCTPEQEGMWRVVE